MHPVSLLEQFIGHLLAVTAGGAIAAFAFVVHRYRKVSWLWVLIAIGVGCRVFFAIATPTFDAPDEEPHFRYVQFVAEHRALPVQRSRTDDNLREWEYYQPPLYYLLLAPGYIACRTLGMDEAGTVVTLRLFSIGLWVIGLCGLLRLLRHVRLDEGLVAVAAVAAYCCLPTLQFISSVINNDNMIMAAGTWLLALATAPDNKLRSWLGVGALLAICLWSKLSAVLLATFLALLALASVARASLLQMRVIGPLVAIAIGALCWLPLAVRNYALYGSLTAESIANVPKVWDNLVVGVIKSLWQMHWSFWASAGITNDVRGLFPYLGIAAFYTVLGLCVWRARDFSFKQYAADPRSKLFLVSAVTLLVACALLFRFGVLYGQAQGRLLFPLAGLVVIALALVARCGLRHDDARTSNLIAVAWAAYGSAFAAYSAYRFSLVG